jgi:Rieske Fe-S protein
VVFASQGDPTQEVSATLTTEVAHTSQRITSAGGTLRAPGFEVFVPSGGVAEDTMLIYTSLVSPTTALSTEYGFARSFVFEALAPEGGARISMAKPYEMTVSVQDLTLANDALLLMRDDQEWIDVVAACVDMGCEVVVHTPDTMTIRSTFSGEFALAQQAIREPEGTRVYLPLIVR